MHAWQGMSPRSMQCHRHVVPRNLAAARRRRQLSCGRAPAGASRVRRPWPSPSRPRLHLRRPPQWRQPARLFCRGRCDPGRPRRDGWCRAPPLLGAPAAPQELLQSRLPPRCTAPLHRLRLRAVWPRQPPCACKCTGRRLLSTVADSTRIPEAKSGHFRALGSIECFPIGMSHAVGMSQCPYSMALSEVYRHVYAHPVDRAKAERAQRTSSWGQP